MGVQHHAQFSCILDTDVKWAAWVAAVPTVPVQSWHHWACSSLGCEWMVGKVPFHHLLPSSIMRSRVPQAFLPRNLLSAFTQACPYLLASYPWERIVTPLDGHMFSSGEDLGSSWEGKKSRRRCGSQTQGISHSLTAVSTGCSGGEGGSCTETS